jgi:hypothetical protein
MSIPRKKNVHFAQESDFFFLKNVQGPLICAGGAAFLRKSGQNWQKGTLNHCTRGFGMRGPLCHPSRRPKNTMGGKFKKDLVKKKTKKDKNVKSTRLRGGFWGARPERGFGSIFTFIS